MERPEGDLAHARTHETFFNEDGDVAPEPMHEEHGDRSSNSLKHVGVGQVWRSQSFIALLITQAAKRSNHPDIQKWLE